MNAGVIAVVVVGFLLLLGVVFFSEKCDNSIESGAKTFSKGDKKRFKRGPFLLTKPFIACTCSVEYRSAPGVLVILKCSY